MAKSNESNTLEGKKIKLEPKYKVKFKSFNELKEYWKIHAKYYAK